MISVSGEERTVFHAKYPAKIAEKKTKMNLSGHIVGKTERDSETMVLFLYTEIWFLERDSNSGKRIEDDNKMKPRHSFKGFLVNVWNTVPVVF